MVGGRDVGWGGGGWFVLFVFVVDESGSGRVNGVGWSRART